MLGADDRVLLALDRLDDVVHVPGARGVERRQQRALAADAVVGADHTVASGGIEIEVFVVDRGHGAIARADVPAAGDVFGVGGGGQVERAGQRSSPVEQQRLVVVVLVEDAEPADVARLVLGALEIDPAEAQTVLGGVVFGQILVVELGERLALTARLRRAHAASSSTVLSRFCAYSRMASSRS